MSRLDSCPDVVCHGEIFKRKRIDIRPEHRGGCRSRRCRRATPTRSASSPGSAGSTPTSTSASRSSAAPTAPAAAAHDRRAGDPRIVLTRAPLEIYASFLRMRATGVHKLGEGERPPSEALAAKVRFSLKSFGRFAAGHNRFMTMSHLIAALPQSFVIDYAQINDEAALDALFGFVGARAASSATAFRKQYAGSLEDGFENWGRCRTS